MFIYLASSWRNPHYAGVLQSLRRAGHTVYDFREPEHSFAWEDIDPRWRSWSASKFKDALLDDRAKAHFDRDRDALEHCDALVLLLPCGNDAHIEAGFAEGNACPVYVLAPEGDGLLPGLMYKMFGDDGNIYTSTEDLIGDLHFQCSNIQAAQEEREGSGVIDENLPY